MTDQPVSTGLWRLRLIGSSAPLIAPRDNKPDLVSSFEIREARDYYIPNNNSIIMRYKVTVSDDHLTSLHFTTSKPDVLVRLAIYDNGEEMLSVIGKGVLSIPAYIFLKDKSTAEPDNSRPGSKTCKLLSRFGVKYNSRLFFFKSQVNGPQKRAKNPTQSSRPNNEIIK